MHILLLAPGESIHSQRFLEMLLHKGYAVTFVDHRNPRQDEIDGYRFIPLPPRVRGLRRLGGRAAIRLESWIRIVQIRLIWNQVRPDLVNVHYLDERASYCARAGLRPLILSCWGSDINSLFDPKRRDAGRRHRIASALAAADHITADARGVIDRCEQLVGHTLAATLWNFGVNPEKFKPGFASEAQSLRRKLGIPLTSKVILSSRRLDPLQRQHHILQAFADITHDPQMPEAVLVFRRYLPTTETENALRLQAKELGVEHKVRWLDESPYDDVPFHYAMADIVVNYPERDALPVSLLEAAASKRPVVSSNLAAYEVFTEDSFLFVPPADAPGLAETLKVCLTEQPLQTQRRVEKAYAIVREIGDQRKNMEIMASIFEMALARRRSWLPGQTPAKTGPDGSSLEELGERSTLSNR